MAKNGALPIVPVLLDDTVPTGGLRFFLSTHRWLDTRGKSAATWHKTSPPR